MSSYAFFVQTCREEHKKKHPDSSVNFAEFSKKCFERWKTMSAKEKSKFEDMAKSNKARYDREMKNYVPPKAPVKEADEGGFYLHSLLVQTGTQKTQGMAAEQVILLYRS
ncbi:hypothetical protein AB1E18_002074 [Capra hircus]